MNGILKKENSNEDLTEYKNKCRDILSDWDNDWSWDFTQSILDYMEKYDKITEKQKDGIDNILRKMNGG